MHAKVFKGKCTDVCNLLWNTSKDESVKYTKMLIAEYKWYRCVT